MTAGAATLEVAETGSRTAATGRRSVWRLLVVALVVVVAVAVGLARWPPRWAPGEDSAEVGFARDMSVHHQQAVEMALAIRGRSGDPLVEGLANDILLTQQHQVGQMRGWLDAWDRSPIGAGPRMAWMGHATEGPMPGMASREELNRLGSLEGVEADREFLRLMIRHHEGGVPMAQAAVERSDDEAVRALAGSIVTGQQVEVESMREMLEGKGGAASVVLIGMGE